MSKLYSPGLITLLEGLLQVNPLDRLNAHEALELPWFDPLDLAAVIEVKLKLMEADKKAP